MAARKLESGVFAVAFVVLVVLAGNTAGWVLTSTRAVLAARLDHSASAPLYDVLAGVAALIPVGEPAFRLQLLGAVLGALTLVGVVVASREILGSAAGVVGAVLLVLAPPFREALATPQVLAACGTVWAIVYAKRQAPRGGFAMCALIVGSAPWLGLVATLAAIAWFAKGKSAKRATEIAVCVAAIGVMIVALWFDARGAVPMPHISLASAVAVSGRGAVVIGAGLLGISFAVVSGLAWARTLAAITAVVAIHELAIGDSGVAMLAVLAIGASIVAAAIVRMAANELAGWKRDAAVIACGAPLVIAALAMGVATDDPRDTPRRLVADLIDQVPAGPGAFIATRPPVWFAMQYETAIAGMRPDLTFVPPLPAQRADVIAANALRLHLIVAADAAAFGRLDERLAMPRGRGFQLLGAPPDHEAPILPVADYVSVVGVDEAISLALERAEHEAASGRLAAAARAVGLDHRFGAADLAVLSATVPAKDRPALFGFLPLGQRSADTLDVFGDDLAWIANIPLADPPLTASLPRRLHAAWRKIFMGTAKPDGPEITQLGSTAVEATRLMLAALREPPRP